MPAINFPLNLVDGLFLVTEFDENGDGVQTLHVNNTNLDAKTALLVFAQLGANCFEKPSEIDKWVAKEVAAKEVAAKEVAANAPK